MRSLRLRRRLEEQLVDIAPAPILAGLEALHHRMLRRLEMLGRVLARRLIAATDMAANQAHPQMDPATMRLQAFLAALRRARRDVADLIKMVAALGHARLLSQERRIVAFWVVRDRFSTAPEAKHGDHRYAPQPDVSGAQCGANRDR